MPYKDYEQQKANAREYYYKNRDKKLAQAKEYYYNNWLKKKEYRSKWEKDNPEKIKAYQAKYNKKYLKDNPEKQKAHNAVRWAIEIGKIIKPNKCTVCKKEYNSKYIHGHHHKGYDEINKLNIIWLCGSCHRKEHYVKKNN